MRRTGRRARSRTLEVHGARVSALAAQPARRRVVQVGFGTGGAHGLDTFAMAAKALRDAA